MAGLGEYFLEGREGRQGLGELGTLGEDVGARHAPDLELSLDNAELVFLKADDLLSRFDLGAQ